MSFDYNNMYNDPIQVDPPQADPSQARDILQPTTDENVEKPSIDQPISQIWGKIFDTPQESGEKQTAEHAVAFDIEGDIFVVHINPSPEQLEKALAKGNIATMSPDGKGGHVAKTPAGFESQGITQAEFRNPDGTTTTHASVRFETLSDKELAALKSQIKARIVYLKLSDPDNKDKKESELKYLQTLLKFVESEEALRKKKPEEFKRLNGKQINTISKMEAKWSALRAMQNANQEIREARAEEKQETVRVIVKQKVIKEEIIKEGVLFARTLGKTVLESEEAKEKINGDVKENGSKIKTVDYVSISPTINKNPRRVFVNMGSLLIRYRSI